MSMALNNILQSKPFGAPLRAFLLAFAMVKPLSEQDRHFRQRVGRW